MDDLEKLASVGVFVNLLIARASIPPTARRTASRLFRAAVQSVPGARQKDREDAIAAFRGVVMPESERPRKSRRVTANRHTVRVFSQDDVSLSGLATLIALIAQFPVLLTAANFTVGGAAAFVDRRLGRRSAQTLTVLALALMWTAIWYATGEARDVLFQAERNADTLFAGGVQAIRGLAGDEVGRALDWAGQWIATAGAPTAAAARALGAPTVTQTIRTLTRLPARQQVAIMRETLDAMRNLRTVTGAHLALQALWTVFGQERITAVGRGIRDAWRRFRGAAATVTGIDMPADPAEVVEMPAQNAQRLERAQVDYAMQVTQQANRLRGGMTEQQFLETITRGLREGARRSRGNNGDSSSLKSRR